MIISMSNAIHCKYISTIQKCKDIVCYQRTHMRILVDTLSGRNHSFTPLLFPKPHHSRLWFAKERNSKWCHIEGRHVNSPGFPIEKTWELQAFSHGVRNRWWLYDPKSFQSPNIDSSPLSRAQELRGQKWPKVLIVAEGIDYSGLEGSVSFEGALSSLVALWMKLVGFLVAGHHLIVDREQCLLWKPVFLNDQANFVISRVGRWTAVSARFPRLCRMLGLQ